MFSCKSRQSIRVPYKMEPPSIPVIQKYQRKTKLKTKKGERKEGKYLVSGVLQDFYLCSFFLGFANILVLLKDIDKWID